MNVNADPATDQAQSGRGLKFVRRAHLFLGLFMAPWILAYGISGLYFHHPRWFSFDAPPRPEPVEFSTAGIPGSEPGDGPEVDVLVQKIVAALNQRPAAAGSSLVAGSSRIEGRVSVPLKWEQAGGSATIDRGAKTGMIARNAVRTITLEKVVDPLFDRAAMARLRTGLVPVLQQADPAIKEIGSPTLPELRFRVEQNGQLWNAACDLTTGNVSLTSVQPARVITFLGRLHRTFGNIATSSPIRTLWMGLTDLVALTLCFWVLTGLVMWYQLKVVRRAGYIVLGAAVIVAVLVLAGMWREFADLG